jgi:prolyl oligopeptidase PreP (S9A serine peptidase family)
VLVLVAVLCLAVPGAGTVVAEDPDTDAQFYRHVTAGASGVAQFGGPDETMAIVSL